eukprot:8677935-Pyramimonas_sp.AAC.1
MEVRCRRCLCVARIDGYLAHLLNGECKPLPTQAWAARCFFSKPTLVVHDFRVPVAGPCVSEALAAAEEVL